MGELDGYWKQFRRDYIPAETDPTTVAALYMAFMAGSSAHHNALDRAAGMKPMKVAEMAVVALDAEVQRYARVLALNLEQIKKAREAAAAPPTPSTGSEGADPGALDLEERLARIMTAWFGFAPEEWKRCKGNAAEIIAALPPESSPTASESSTGAPPRAADPAVPPPTSPGDSASAPPAG